MADSADLRRRLMAAQVDLPDTLIDLVAVSVGPMITALDELARVDLGLLEPFDPARRLADDAAR